MPSLTVDQMRNPPQPTKEQVPVPEFGEGAYVWVHGLTLRQRETFDSSFMNAKWTAVDPAKMKQQKARLIVQCTRSDSGERILSIDDIDVVQEWPADAAQRIYEAANRLSGGTAPTVEETEKNSEETLAA